MGNVFDSQSSGSGSGTGRMMDEKHLTNWRILEWVNRSIKGLERENFK